MALTWCIPGQSSDASEAVPQEVKREGALVPSIWHIEMSNILGLRWRDGNLSEHNLQVALGVCKFLDITTDTQRFPDGLPRLIGDIMRFRLAAYDALYVELALRTGCPLATFDKAMIASARTHGVSVLGGR